MIVGEDAPCDAENPEDCAADEGEDGDNVEVEPLPGLPGGIPIVIPGLAGAGGGVSLVMLIEIFYFCFGVSNVLFMSTSVRTSAGFLNAVHGHLPLTA